MLPLFLTAAVSFAATYDPDLKWRTISTEHFDIHFHQGVEQVADEFSQSVERIYDTMTEEVAWTPRPRIQLTLVDRTDEANGFASAVPLPNITIYVTAPGEDSALNLYENWNEAIFTHELTHVLHLDTNHGIVRAARAVVGRVASTNGLSPGWMVEGFATFQETRHTAGGRGRAAWPDMLKRTAVLEDDFPPLGNLDGFQPDPPGGNLRYIFGQDFIQYVADHQGENVWTRWVHVYGGWVPFLLPTKRAFGRQLVPLYQEWKAASFARYEAQAAQVRAEGETTGRLVSTPEASCIAPSFSPDGEKLVWSCYDLRLGSSIWMADGDGYGPEKLLENNGAGYFTWRADSKAFVFAAVHLVNRFNAWSDIYLYPLGGSVTSLTNGARARDPDFSPDGSKLLYVTNGAQDNALEVLTVDRRREELGRDVDGDGDEDDGEGDAAFAPSDHTQYSTPRYSPDGSVIALSVWKEGRRDLWLYSPGGEPIRRLTMDAAIDADPFWSADGRWLYFSSDRTGIPNVYAIETGTERLWQVTNVVTGAVRPSPHPSGERLAYMEYSTDGWDVRVMDLDPSKFIDRGLLPSSLEYGAPIRSVDPAEQTRTAAVWPEWESDAPGARSPRAPALPPTPLAFGPQQSTEVLDNFGDTEVEDVFGEERDYPFHITPHRYNPLPSLLPRYILPFLQTTPYRPRPPLDFTCLSPLLCPSLQVAVVTGASDSLSRYGWNASLSYRTDAQYLGGGAALTINRYLPVYTFGAVTQAVAPAQLAFVDTENPLNEDGSLRWGYTDPAYFYWEKRSTGYATVSWPYRLRSTAFAQYSFTDRRPRFTLPENVFAPSIPFVGYVGAVSGGWRYSWSEPTAYAISAEDGEVFSLIGTIRHPWLGAFSRNLETDALEPLSQVQLTSEIRRYITNPWLANHVLAVRAAGGVTFGQNDFFGNYVLGGSIGDSGFLVTPDEFRMVRGYPYAADIGDLYWLGEAEYRMPLLRIERGVGTVPFYARTLSGALFVDAANAFVNPSLVTGVPSTADDLLDAALEAPLIGVGAEITIRTVIAYGVGLSGRLGYGMGLTAGGYRPWIDDGPGGQTALSPLYFQLGGSF